MFVVWMVLLLVVILVALSYAPRNSQRRESESPVATQARLEALFEHAPIAYCEIDAKGAIVRVNRKECNLRYLGAQDLMGVLFWDLAPVEDRERLQEEILRKLGGDGSLLPIRRQMRRPNGQVITVESHESLLRDTSGEARGMLIATIDITENQKQQEEVFRTTTELKALFQALPDTLIRLDGVGTVLEVKEGGLGESFGALGDLKGKRLAEALDPQEGLKVTQALQRLQKTHAMVMVELTGEVGGKKEIYEARFCPNYRSEAIAVIRRITERREAESRLEQNSQQLEAKNEQLAKALREAREATEMKSRFLANMSHEIRTPMNGIVGMTEFLLNTPLNSEQREYAVAVKNSSDSLLLLINDILDLSKIEAGKLRISSVPFDLVVTVEELAAIFAVRARAKGLEFICAATDDVPQFVVGDPGRLRQVLTNLLGNAIKFTERGKVSVLTELIGESEQTCTLRFMVQDTGIGISSEDKDKLFQNFVQLDSSSTRKYGGTGLGLAISKQLVEMMGGDIGYNSERGRGSTFFFTAVFLKAPAVIPPENGTSSAAESVKELSGAAVALVAARGTASESLVKLLSGWNCQPTLVDDLLLVREMIQRPKSDGPRFRIVLLDVDHVPGQAEQFARSLQQSGQWKDLALIALTSQGYRQDVSRLVESGFRGLVSKPIRIQQLYEMMLESIKPAAQDASTAAKSPQSDPEAGPLVLLAEDNAINQRIAVRLLQKLGLRVDVVNNGREAIEAIERKSYAMILMDCQMPEMDGFEATAEIRKREDGKRRIPICALTANAMVGDRERCIASGMDDYVSKPVALHDLQGALSRLLGYHAPSKAPAKDPAVEKPRPAEDAALSEPPEPVLIELAGKPS
ncbi:MAG: response regulator [Bryobacterales bacterium]|nr:response regulator [Bryobacterales bacterium]